MGTHPEWNGTEWTCEIDIPAWRPLYRGSGEKLLEVIFLPDKDAPNAPPNEQQKASVLRILEIQAGLRDDVEQAIHSYYFRLRPRYLPYLKNSTKDMPQELSRRDFERLHELQTVFIHRRGAGALTRVGLSFRALWEVEHGVGVVILDDEVRSVGAADTAFLDVP